MKINFDRPLKNINDIDFKNEDGSVLTLKQASIEALLYTPEDKKNMSGDEKFKRYSICMKIKSGEEVSIEELSLIKESVGLLYNISVVGAAYKMLEG